MAQEKQDSPSYKSMLLAYMDLLGFRKRVQEAGANANEIRQIWKILDSARELAQRRTNMTAVMTQAYQFSDTLVIAVEAAFPGAARLLLNWVTYFQMTALSDGWLVRGGIAEGDMMIEGSIWFGPGLIRAYDLERTVVDPVVVVDPQVYEQGSWIDCAFYCQEMPKGLPIVDYLGTTIAYGIFLEADVANRTAERLGVQVNTNWCSPIGSDFVAKHRDLVATALTNERYVHDLRVWSKYKWLQTYHNSTIRRFCAEANGQSRPEPSFMVRAEWFRQQSLRNTPSTHLERADLLRVMQAMAKHLAPMTI